MRWKRLPKVVFCSVAVIGLVGTVGAFEEPGPVAGNGLSRGFRNDPPGVIVGFSTSPKGLGDPRPAENGTGDAQVQNSRSAPAQSPFSPARSTTQSNPEEQMRHGSSTINTADPLASASSGSRPIHAPNPHPLTLAEMEKLALVNNPTIGQAETLIEQQQGVLRQLTRYPNPTFGWLQSTPTQLSRGATQGAFISQDFVTAGKLRVAGWAETEEIEISRWQLKAQIGRVLSDIRIRFYEVLGAQQAVGAAMELERLSLADLDAVKQLFEAKQSSRPDILQAEIHLSAVQSTLQDARLRHQAAWRQLANVIGDPQLAQAELSEGGFEDPPVLDWQESLHRLMTESPVLLAQAAQVREAEFEVQLQKRLVIPNITVQTVIQRDYVRDFSQVSTLVSAPIPLFNRNRGNIMSAEAMHRQQQYEYKRVQLALADQLATSFQQYLAARNQVDHLREILPRTRENLKLTTEAFRGGQSGFDFIRVLDAEQTYYQTRISYIDSMTTLRKLAIEITGLELTGGLNPTLVGTALQGSSGAGSGVRNVLLQQAQQQNAGTNRILPGAVQSTIGGVR